MEDVLFKPVKSHSEIEEIQSMYNVEEVMLEDLKINDNLQVLLRNETVRNTDDFLHGFYGILNIPYPFTRKIPTDLLVTNVDRLSQEFNIPVKIVSRDGVLINVVSNINRKGQPVFFQQINSSLLLDNFSNDSFELKNSYAGDYGLVMDVIHKDLGQLELETEEGDIVDIGYRLRNPFTMFGNKLDMSIYLNQLVCKNGMIIGRDFGGVHLNLTKDLGDEETFLQRFRANIDMNISRKFTLDKILEIYNGMVRTNIKNRWLKPIMNNVRKIDDELFTRVFHCSWDDEKEILQDSFENNETDDSDYNYFETIFNITKEAQKESVSNRLFLEEYNNSIINLYKKQLLVTTNLN